MRWFLTQKISWNTTNPFPHHTFWWEGIDGTRVFTHFPPGRHLQLPSSPAPSWPTPRPTSATRAARRRALAPFGYGDGGGGPTREMLGRARRTADLAGSPRVRVETPAVVLHRGRGGVRRPGAGVGRRALPRDPPRHLHLAGRDEAGQPTLRAPAPRGRAVVGDGGGPGAARLPVRRAAARPGRRCCCTSSTTSCRARRSPGCTARRGRRTPGRSPTWRPSSSTPSTRWPEGGAEQVAFNAAPVARLGVPALGAAVPDDTTARLATAVAGRRRRGGARERRPPGRRSTPTA